jgi:hypothetical protein
MSPDQRAALSQVVKEGRIEIRYARSAHHFLANIGLLRKTILSVPCPRVGKARIPFYVPTVKGRKEGSDV